MSLKNVDISDLIRARIFQTAPGVFSAEIVCLEKNKNVVIDEKALKTLNEEITERCRAYSASDPKTIKFIEEFVVKMVSALHKNGLAELEDAKVQDAKEDHYKEARKYEKMRTR